MLLTELVLYQTHDRYLIDQAYFSVGHNNMRMCGVA